MTIFTQQDINKKFPEFLGMSSAISQFILSISSNGRSFPKLKKIYIKVMHYWRFEDFSDLIFIIFLEMGTGRDSGGTGRDSRRRDETGLKSQSRGTRLNWIGQKLSSMSL